MAIINYLLLKTNAVRRSKLGLLNPLHGVHNSGLVSCLTTVDCCTIIEVTTYNWFQWFTSVKSSMVYRLRRADADLSGWVGHNSQGNEKTDDSETRYGKIFGGGVVEKQTNQNGRLDVSGMRSTGYEQRNNKSAGFRFFSDYWFPRSNLTSSNHVDGRRCQCVGAA